MLTENCYMVFTRHSVDKIWSSIYMQDSVRLSDGLHCNSEVRLSKKLYDKDGLFDNNF